MWVSLREGLSLVIAAATRLDGSLATLLVVPRLVPPALRWLALLPLALLVALLCRLGSRVPPVGRVLGSERLVTIVAALSLLVLWAPPMLVFQGATIGGESYWWLHDDAMISMRYARNLATGAGLVWNPGERVEGYTNFAWTLYMGLVHLAGLPDSKTSLVILLTVLGLAVLTIGPTIRLVRLLGGSAVAAVLAVTGYVLCRSAMINAATGLETTLLSLVFLLALCRVLEEARRARPRPATYLLIAALPLVRADALVLTGLLVGLAFVLNSDRRSVATLATVSLLLPGAHELFRLLYYGDVLPNTAYLKVMGWSGRGEAGLQYVKGFAGAYAFPLGLAAIGALVREGAFRYLTGLVLLYAAYVAYIGGDVFAYSRFFVPVVPLVLVLAFVSLEALGPRPLLKAAVGTMCLLATPLVIPGYQQALRPFGFFRVGDKGNVEMALLIKQNIPPTGKVAATAAGSIFYFSRRPGVDLLGKNDRHVARLAAFAGSQRHGHNKFDYDYSLGVLKPDFAIAAEFRPDATESTMRTRLSGDLAFSGQFYFNPVFRDHFLPNPVRADTWRTIYVADWSQQWTRRNDWTPLPADSHGSSSASPRDAVAASSDREARVSRDDAGGGERTRLLPRALTCLASGVRLRLTGR